MNHIQQITSQLVQLKNIIDDAKAILEWHKLKVFENSSNPSSNLLFQDDTACQLADKQSVFQMVWIETTILLQNKSINLSLAEKTKFQKELNKLSLQFYYLGSDVRIY